MHERYEILFKTKSTAYIYLIKKLEIDLSGQGDSSMAMVPVDESNNSLVPSSILANEKRTER